MNAENQDDHDRNNNVSVIAEGIRRFREAAPSSRKERSTTLKTCDFWWVSEDSKEDNNNKEEEDDSSKLLLLDDSPEKLLERPECEISTDLNVDDNNIKPTLPEHVEDNNDKPTPPEPITNQNCDNLISEMFNDYSSERANAFVESADDIISRLRKKFGLPDDTTTDVRRTSSEISGSGDDFFNKMLKKYCGKEEPSVSLKTHLFASNSTECQDEGTKDAEIQVNSNHIGTTTTNNSSSQCNVKTNDAVIQVSSPSTNSSASSTAVTQTMTETDDELTKKIKAVLASVNAAEIKAATDAIEIPSIDKENDDSSAKTNNSASERTMQSSAKSRKEHFTPDSINKTIVTPDVASISPIVSSVVSDWLDEKDDTIVPISSGSSNTTSSKVLNNNNGYENDSVLEKIKNDSVLRVLKERYEKLAHAFLSK